MTFSLSIERLLHIFSLAKNVSWRCKVQLGHSQRFVRLCKFRLPATPVLQGSLLVSIDRDLNSSSTPPVVPMLQPQPSPIQQHLS